MDTRFTRQTGGGGLTPYGGVRPATDEADDNSMVDSDVADCDVPCESPGGSGEYSSDRPTVTGGPSKDYLINRRLLAAKK